MLAGTPCCDPLERCTITEIGEPPMEVDPAEFAQFLKEREMADEELDQYVAGLQIPSYNFV